MYKSQPMQNQRPQKKERQLILQETMLQYMAKNYQRMNQTESQRQPDSLPY